MRPPRRALLAALPLVLLLTACTGGAATQGSVRDDVRDALLERDGNDLSQAEALVVGECVARGVFEGDFTEDERGDITRAVDGDGPDADLVARVEAVLDGCVAGGGEE